MATEWTASMIVIQEKAVEFRTGVFHWTPPHYSRLWATVYG